MEEEKLKLRMQQVVDLFKADIGSLRTGRISPVIVENIEVAAYGGTQKLKIIELASITAQDSQTLVIAPWDKSIIGEIGKAIAFSDIGAQPQIGEELIRLSFPPLTTEDRQKFVKVLSQKLENAKILIRQVRADFMHEIKKAFEAKEISEDERWRLEKRLQEVTDEFIAEIEKLSLDKKEELLTI